MRFSQGFRAARTAALVAGAISALAIAVPALAQSAGSGGSSAAPRQSSGTGLYGWGPHIGVSGDPDQLVLGVHLDLGRFAPRVRFQPDVELGFGDNVTIFSFTLPAHYTFRTRSSMAPYAGGGIMIGLVDPDAAGADTDVEVGVAFTGGLEWRTSRNDHFFVELNLIAGDLQDFDVVGGFTFR